MDIAQAKEASHRRSAKFDRTVSVILRNTKISQAVKIEVRGKAKVRIQAALHVTCGERRDIVHKTVNVPKTSSVLTF